MATSANIVVLPKKNRQCPQKMANYNVDARVCVIPYIKLLWHVWVYQYDCMSA